MNKYKSYVSISSQQCLPRKTGDAHQAGELNAAVEYAKLNDDLFALMLNEKSNLMLLQFLLDEYFPGTKSIYKQTPYKQADLFDDLEDKILNEDAATYRAEIKELLAQNNEEEIFLRGSVFKREIPKIYNNTCCISGMKIDATINVSMIDACHIIPFSESYNDTVTNGIALCPNLHRAFDRGLIAIDNNYKVIVSKTFREGESNYSIHRFDGKEILLPRMK
ncbi:MAG: HNH endonuclease [Bacteroidia bacterium]